MPSIASAGRPGPCRDLARTGIPACIPPVSSSMNRTIPSRLSVGLLLFLTAVYLSAASAESPSELTTIAERSAFTRTGRYDEVEKLCAAFAARWPDRARCFEFGRSPFPRSPSPV